MQTSTQRIFTIPALAIALLLWGGCAKSTHENGGTTGTERATLSEEECLARKGKIMGDPGDGRIHRPSYRCPNGRPPLGSIRYDETGDMIPVEGSVCCPR
ncbi:MAG: hypothetical protein NXI24_17020 [bacterium]|nr:hypothetical protein [bacterium]